MPRKILYQHKESMRKRLALELQALRAHMAVADGSEFYVPKLAVELGHKEHYLIGLCMVASHEGWLSLAVDVKAFAWVLYTP